MPLIKATSQNFTKSVLGDIEGDKIATIGVGTSEGLRPKSGVLRIDRKAKPKARARARHAVAVALMKPRRAITRNGIGRSCCELYTDVYFTEDPAPTWLVPSRFF